MKDRELLRDKLLAILNIFCANARRFERRKDIKQKDWDKNFDNAITEILALLP